MHEGRLTPFQGPRLILTVAIMFTTFLILVGRLYQYQFVQHTQFVAKADENAIRQQVAKYTAALDAADTGIASQVWLTTPEVSFISPMA